MSKELGNIQCHNISSYRRAFLSIGEGKYSFRKNGYVGCASFSLNFSNTFSTYTSRSLGNTLTIYLIRLLSAVVPCRGVFVVSL